MKKIILISILLYSISCSFRHIPIMPGGKNNKIEYMKISVLPDTIRFSNNFRMLWDDLLKEANGYLSSKDYTPSEQLREKYNLKYCDNIAVAQTQYGKVKGFILKGIYIPDHISIKTKLKAKEYQSSRIPTH